ncbi:uncharacterized protein LOC111049982 isoform X2 [Nilaparvata lugens]|uniref:uncharacterized protein LOC111049982 isoform X2 n=1 Tax=Nilaparvata lugens TaxID=108931 RepID=UPI00193CA0E0|nr:uncharacterized protein LOC111049982 isoform X2 [Nilaparvata lugens]
MDHRELITALCSTQKLERDNGIVKLDKFLSTCNISDRLTLESIFIEFLNISCNSWETKQGCLTGAKALIPFIDKENEQEIEFSHEIKSIARKCLTDVEVRVRTEAGAVLGSLCQKFGNDVYREEKDYVIELIQNNLERQSMDDEGSYHEHAETERLIEKLSQRRNSSEVIQNSRENSGWKNLETSLVCLQSMILGCGDNFYSFIDNDLVSLIFQTLIHNNRFVQETGFYLCSSLFRCASNRASEESECDSSESPVLTFGRKISEHLALGLADNWSQVKLAASHATRYFLASLPNDKIREVFYPELLPRICLNRYYIAEGVRIYSQETWRQVTGECGQELVERYMACFVQCYLEAAACDNQAVREAACSCIAELACKVDKGAVRPHLPALLQVLLTCFRDTSWPVRDAACLACGSFIAAFPGEAAASMEALYPLFFGNLGDSIAAVRQGAAASLKSVVKAYPDTALQPIIDRINANLKDICNQSSAGPSDIKEMPLYCGGSKRRRDDSDDDHLNSDKWRLGRRGSQVAPLHKQESQPWEHADGSVILLGELSEITWMADHVLQALPNVAEACKFQHYPQHVVFLETVCRNLPILAKNLGIKRFKTAFDLFIDPIFTALTCENALASSTASQCLNQLGSMIGSNILRSRVMNHNPRYIDALDANIFIAPL